MPPAAGSYLARVYDQTLSKGDFEAAYAVANFGRLPKETQESAATSGARPQRTHRPDAARTRSPKGRLRGLRGRGDERAS